MDLKLPKLGEGADSGVVVNVFVKEGDTIAKDQPVLELENEKAIAAIPAPAAGTVSKVHVKPGDKLVVGQRILTFTAAGEPAAAAVAPAPQPRAAVAEAAEPEDEDIPAPVAAPIAAPSIRRLARELGLDLGRVRGSEPGGRIVMADLKAYIARLQAATAKPKPGAAPTPIAAEPVDFSKWGPVSQKPLTPLRQVIARRMWENWNAIPHVTQFDEADFGTVNDLRKTYGPAYEQRGVRLTLTPFVLKALVHTLKKHPAFNASLDETAQALVLKDYYHVGIAVDTEQGLIVPVIRNVDKKTLLELAKELEQLANRTRERKVAAEELKGGTFTLSNQGAIGGAHFTPIINRPEVAILGVGRGVLKPVVRDGQIESRVMVPLAVSYDHRVIDGGMAARFIVDLVKALEAFRVTDVQL